MTNVRRRQTFIVDERSLPTNVRQRRTFVDDERSATTNVCHRQTFVVVKRSSSTNVPRRRTFVVDERSSTTNEGTSERTNRQTTESSPKLDYIQNTHIESASFPVYAISNSVSLYLYTKVPIYFLTGGAEPPQIPPRRRLGRASSDGAFLGACTDKRPIRRRTPEPMTWGGLGGRSPPS